MPNIQVITSKKGIQTFTVDGTSFNWLRPVAKSTEVYGNVTVSAEQTDITGKTITAREKSRVEVVGGHDITYTWGTAQARFVVDGNKITWTVSLLNTSQDSVLVKEVRFLEFMAPASFQMFTNNATTSGEDGPTFIGGTWPESTLENGTIQPAGKPFFVLEQGKGKIKIGNKYWSAFPLTFIPEGTIEPLESRVYRVSLRLGNSTQTAESIVPDAFERTRAKNPYLVKWEDRRPIGRWFLASAGSHPATNKRGWFNNDARIDVTTPEGKLAFANKLIKQAESVAARNKAMDGQGTILWDIEGQQFGHPISYLGFPLIRDLDGNVTGVSLPEEMTFLFTYNGVEKPLIDHVFDVVRSTGKVGVCLRPTNALSSAYAPPVYPSHYNDGDWADLIIDKITYAKARFGCTIFYIDSNLGTPSQWRKIALAHPDVLLIPEWSNVLTFGTTAPYRAADNLSGTPIEPLSMARQIYPQSFGVVAVSAKNLVNDRKRLYNEVYKGAILFFNAWFEDNSINKPIKVLYDEVKAAKLAEAEAAKGNQV